MLGGPVFVTAVPSSSASHTLPRTWGCRQHTFLLLLLLLEERCHCHTGTPATFRDTLLVSLQGVGWDGGHKYHDARLGFVPWSSGRLEQGCHLLTALPRHLMSPSFTTTLPSHMHYNRFQTPQRLLPPTHRKSCVADASDSLFFDFILSIKVHSILEGETKRWGIQLYPLEITQLTPEKDQISIMQ